MNDDKADLLTRLRKVEPDKPGERTRWYRNPDGPEAADEIERLREAIRRLADQDATLSVVGGDVIVEMDATLTDAERRAVAAAAEDCRYHQDPGGRAALIEATLRGLLERAAKQDTTPARNGTPGECSVTERP